MVNILYAVAGEGLGHAYRSIPVIEELERKKHKVIVAAGGHALKVLEKKYKKFVKISSLNLFYHKNKVNNFMTFWMNFPRAFSIISSYFKLKKMMIEKKIQLVITDFEPLAYYSAKAVHLPVISVANQQIELQTYSSVPSGYKNDRFWSNFITKNFAPKADFYFVMSFYDAMPRSEKVFVYFPLIKKSVEKAKANDKGHILVYQTSKSNTKLIPLLKKIDEKFIVYNFGISKKDGNITFKKNSDVEFTKDMASAKAVFLNGSFSVISEAIVLKKPILCEPILGQYEQILNAVKVKEFGLGDYADHLDEDKIKDFIRNIPKYKKNLLKYKVPKKDFFAELEKVVKRVV